MDYGGKPYPGVHSGKCGSDTRLLTVSNEC
jgi:hypothetical protein